MPPAPAFLFQPPASYGPKAWNEETGAGPLSPGALHVPLPLGAVSRCCRPSTRRTATSSCVRRARSNTPLQALTTLNETARSSSARGRWRVRIARRGRRDATPSGSTYAFRRCVSRAADRRRARGAARAAREAAGSGSPTAGSTLASSPPARTSCPTTCPRASTPAAARRVHGRRARAAEPRRDDHEGMTEAGHELPATTSIATRRRRHVTRRWFFQRVRRRPGRRSRCGSAARQRLGAGAGRAVESAGAEAAALSRRRRSASSSCSWPARRATSSCSTTSRSWRSATASCRRPELLKGYRAAFINPNSTLLGPKFKFAKHGQCGAELSELLPHLADDRRRHRHRASRWHTDAFNHAPAQIFMNTGAQQFGRPSMGAWATYGLGSESQDLPGFVVFSTGQKGTERRRVELGQRLPADGLPGRAVPQPAAIRCCTSRTPPGVDDEMQRDSLDAINAAERDAARRGRRPGDRDAHQLVRDGVPHADERAGADGPRRRSRRRRSRCTARSRAKPSFANNCLLARRLVERGVRFVQLFHEAWDQHGGLVERPEGATARRPTRPARRWSRT